jgi:parallel beta-helix repeat protein
VISHREPTHLRRGGDGSSRRARPGGFLPLFVVLAFLALAAPATALSATFHVDENNANCSDGGSGSVSQPFCTISAAASRTTAGTTVLVHAGTYTEQVTARSGASGSPVVFQAAPGEAVTIRGQKYGFYASGKSWVTIEGFKITNTTSDGIHVSSGSKQVQIIGNIVVDAGEPVSGQTAKGISVTDASDVLVLGNIVQRNSNYGIYLVNSTAVKILENETALNAKQISRAASGIRLHSSDGNTVSSNFTHDNEDSGIELVTGSGNNLVVNNVSYKNGDHGVDVLDSPGNRIISNSVYDNVTAGINLEGGSTGGTLANNVSVDNGIGSARTRGNIRVDGTSTSGTTLDYDLVYLTTPDILLVWGSASYNSLAAFRAATGREPHGIEADPRWTNPGLGNFGLEPDSPAIDSADSGASGQSATDTVGNARVDDPRTANTGAGPRTYDDRGALEYQLRDLPPSAALTVAPDSGLVDLDVTADASASSDNDGSSPIESYSFDFGDGSPAAGPQAGATATHTYTQAGTYTVTVTVRDTAGLTSTASDTVTVTDDPPAAAVSVTPSSGLAPLAVVADASTSTDGDGTPIESYTFDFGDGSTPVGPQAGATATHTYTAGGTYTITVTVTDEAGLSSTATAQVVASANLVRNPGFESDTSGWNTSGSGANVVLSRVGDGHTGGWAAKLENTGTTSSTCTLNDSPNWAARTSAGEYTASLWVRAPAAGAVLKLRLREYVGPTLAGSAMTQVTLTTSWQQVTVTYRPASPGSSTLDYNAYVVGAAPGTCFFADDALLFVD